MVGNSYVSLRSIPDAHAISLPPIGRINRPRQPKTTKPPEGGFVSESGDYLPQTRLRYSPVRVSISILSPVATKIGTGTSKPVASLAGLSTLPEVSPLMAGSV